MYSIVARVWKKKEIAICNDFITKLLYVGVALHNPVRCSFPSLDSPGVGG